MQWGDVGKLVGEYAPLLGDLLPIPGAGAAGRLIAAAMGVDNEPSAIYSAVKNDPDAAVKLRKLELDNSALLQQQLLAAETARINSVNKTMQSEATSEHWAQWLWRPYNGFLFGTTLFMVYALPAITNSFAPIFSPPTIKTIIVGGIEKTQLIATWLPVEISHVPEFVFVAWGGVLGVTAWKRGASKPSGG